MEKERKSSVSRLLLPLSPTMWNRNSLQLAIESSERSYIGNGQMSAASGPRRSRHVGVYVCIDSWVSSLEISPERKKEESEERERKRESDCLDEGHRHGRKKRTSASSALLLLLFFFESYHRTEPCTANHPSSCRPLSLSLFLFLSS